MQSKPMETKNRCIKVALKIVVGKFYPIGLYDDFKSCLWVSN